KAVRNGAPNRKRSATPGPDPLLDIGMTATLAGFAPAMPDGSPPLATTRSDSTSPSESARRQSCVGGPTARQVDPRKAMARPGTAGANSAAGRTQLIDATAIHCNPSS